jgi:Arc/MetJ-type ribon-helix-helix transcriptional regulator
MMVRTQVRLTNAQIEALRRLSAATGQSVSELVRNAVDHDLAERTKRALRVSGKFSSGLSDVSVRHDDYLAEAFRT